MRGWNCRALETSWIMDGTEAMAPTPKPTNVIRIVSAYLFLTAKKKKEEELFAYRRHHT
jgi:hypothetical protein